MKTLPQLAIDFGVSLDKIREVVRENPELAALAVKFGPTRAFNAAAARKIRAALDAEAVAA